MNWTAIKPLPYGDFIFLYENGEHGKQRYAELFKRTLPSFENCTPSDIDEMFEWAPRLLEYAILKASGYLENGEEEEEDETDEKGGIWASKSASEKAKEEAADIKRSDLIFALHQNNEPYTNIYSLTMLEINELFEGSERANRKTEEIESHNEPTKPERKGRGKASGNRADRASQLGWR